MSRFYRKLLINTIAMIVLAAGIIPPGVRHSHSDGDHPHDHHAESHLAGHHAHPHHEHDDAEHEPDHDDADLNHSEYHIHLDLLGFPLSLPDSQGRHNDEGPEPFLVDHTPHFVQLVDVRVVQPGDAPVWLECIQFALSNAAFRSCVFPSPPICRDARPISSPPLCDRARHERSGVLLI